MIKSVPFEKFLLLILVATIALSNVANAAKRGGVKAVIVYTYDESTSGSSVVTMEVDKSTFMNVIESAQTNVRDAKPLKFVQNNGFFDLLEGDSSQFSFMTTSGMADCDCKCSRRPTIPTTTLRVVSTTPRIIPTTTTTTRFIPTTRPKLECNGRGGKEPYCCANNANNKDCCLNNGVGKYCCTNGVTNNAYCCENNAQNPQCQLPTPTTPRPIISRTSTAAPTYLPPLPTTKNPCPRGGTAPYCCSNNANNPDCCLNGGKGKYCCTNNADNPDCSLPRISTTTTTARTTTPGRKQECSNNGRLPYCCENGANNQDCCLNNGKGKYCCTNGANNPTCELPRITTTTRRIPTTTKFRGPAYLPIARVTTERPVTTTQTYTYGTRPTYTYRFSFTNGAWTYVPRSTSYTTRETSTTAKYEYKQPENALNYNSVDNAL